MTNPPPRTTRLGADAVMYHDRWLHWGRATVQIPDGRRFDHHVITMPPVAIAVLHDPEAEAVLMLYRHRWVIDAVGFELLGGLVEPGEAPAAAAAREAEEESGWRPIGSPRHVASFQPLPGMIDAPVEIFSWTTFEQVSSSKDAEEVGELCWVPIAGLPLLLAQGELLGSGTVIAALHLLAARLLR